MLQMTDVINDETARALVLGISDFMSFAVAHDKCSPDESRKLRQAQRIGYEDAAYELLRSARTGNESIGSSLNSACNAVINRILDLSDISSNPEFQKACQKEVDIYISAADANAKKWLHQVDEFLPKVRATPSRTHEVQSLKSVASTCLLCIEDVASEGKKICVDYGVSCLRIQGYDPTHNTPGDNAFQTRTAAHVNLLQFNAQRLGIEKNQLGIDGFCSNTLQLASVERYDLAINQWRGQMTAPRPLNGNLKHADIALRENGGDANRIFVHEFAHLVDWRMGLKVQEKMTAQEIQEVGLFTVDAGSIFVFSRLPQYVQNRIPGARDSLNEIAQAGRGSNEFLTPLTAHKPGVHEPDEEKRRLDRGVWVKDIASPRGLEKAYKEIATAIVDAQYQAVISAPGTDPAKALEMRSAGIEHMMINDGYLARRFIGHCRNDHPVNALGLALQEDAAMQKNPGHRAHTGLLDMSRETPQLNQVLSQFVTSEKGLIKMVNVLEREKAVQSGTSQVMARYAIGLDIWNMAKKNAKAYMSRDEEMLARIIDRPYLKSHMSDIHKEITDSQSLVLNEAQRRSINKGWSQFMQEAGLKISGPCKVASLNEVAAAKKHEPHYMQLISDGRERLAKKHAPAVR